MRKISAIPALADVKVVWGIVQKSKFRSEERISYKCSLEHITRHAIFCHGYEREDY
jgi:hypothetical protein